MFMKSRLILLSTMTEYNNGHLIAAIVICLVIGGAIGAFGFPTEKEVIVAGDYVTVNGADYTAGDIEALIGLNVASLEINSILQDENRALIDKYAEQEREDEVLQIAKNEIEKEFIDDLDLDDDIYDDYYFTIMYTNYDVDEDSDTNDYDIEIDFRIFQYDEDTDELFDEFDAIATMEVEDDDEVDDLEIVLA